MPLRSAGVNGVVEYPKGLMLLCRVGVQERKAAHKQGLSIKRLLGSEVSSSTWDKVSSTSRTLCAHAHERCCSVVRRLPLPPCFAVDVPLVVPQHVQPLIVCGLHGGCSRNACVLNTCHCRLFAPPLPGQFYEFYQITIDKWWGRPYLKREFFHRIGEDMGDEVLLVVAEEQGDTVAAALNMIGR